MATVIQRYGRELTVDQADETTELKIELAFIRDTQDPKELFQHYRRAISLAWPDEDHHRWSDLILRSILENRLVVLTGSRDSGKTHGAAKYVLIDYWAFPEETLVLMTSTTLQGLEMRVWGGIKKLFREAKERYPWLAGNVVDAKHGLFTDNISDEAEVRVQNKGIIGIPTMSSQEEYQGTSLRNFAGIKQRRRRLVGDECFPAGTQVDTPTGSRAIETIRPGDWVMSAVGPSRVMATSVRNSELLVRIHLHDGSRIDCTPNHPFLTTHGWINAIDILPHHMLVSTHEAMRIMRQGVFPRWSEPRQTEVLQQEMSGVGTAQKVSALRQGVPSYEPESNSLFSLLRDEIEVGTARISPQNAFFFGTTENFNGSFHKPSNSQQSVGTRNPPSSHDWSSGLFEDEAQSRRNRPSLRRSRDQSRSYTGRKAPLLDLSRSLSRPLHSYREILKAGRIPNVLVGLGLANASTGRRSGWVLPPYSPTNGKRSDSGPMAETARVDRIEILRPSSSESYGGRSRSYRVYNLQVEGHPSYSVNGLIVHNCQFLPTDYLKVLDSLDKGDFHGVLLGNPIADNGRALDKVSEPVNGWNSLGEISKTTTWKNKYGGLTVNLVGIDSPNFDKDRKKHYAYMVDEDDVKRVSERPGGKDSVEWWSLIMGVRKSGVIMNRVLTLDMVENNGGFKSCLWNLPPRLKIMGIDAGFGGDPCVATAIECGEEVGGGEVILFGSQEIVPIAVSSGTTAEDQIANWTKTRCDTLGIPYANVFVECGMRATLAVSFSRILSPEINAINFGGPATQRPMANGLFVYDERNNTRRSKTCYEHFSKFVTEMAYNVRYVVEYGQARNFPRQAAEEFQKRMVRFVYNDRHELETKAEYKERNGGESCNYADSVMTAVEGALRLGFQIKKQMGTSPPASLDWLRDLRDKSEKFHRNRALVFAR